MILSAGLMKGKRLFKIDPLGMPVLPLISLAEACFHIDSTYRGEQGGFTLWSAEFIISRKHFNTQVFFKGMGR